MGICAAIRRRASSSESPFALDEARKLPLGRARDDDDAVELAVVPGFIQQRDVGDGEGRARDLGAAQPPLNRLVHGRMDDGFEIPSAGIVGENRRRQARTVERAIGDGAPRRRSAS